MIITRAAEPQDAQAMCDLLNPIIEEGTTTAHRQPFDADKMRETHIDAPRLVQTTLALEDGALLGFQLLKWRNPDEEGPEALPEGWAVIASFVRDGQQGKGIGQILWKTTQVVAREAGVKTIDATIRTDNEPGLAYYSGLGFQDYAELKNLTLSDGSVVSKIRKRLDL